MQKPLRPVAPDSTLIELPAANHSVTNPVFRWRDFCMDQQGTERGIFPPMFPDKIKFTFQGKSVFPSDDPFYILRHRPPVPSQRVLQVLQNFQQKILHKGNTFTAFGTASGKDFTSAFGCHSCSETATAGSDEFGGLISSFHCSLPFPSAFSTEACYCFNTDLELQKLTK